MPRPDPRPRPGRLTARLHVLHIGDQGFSCEGGGGSTAVLNGTSLYTRGFPPIDTPIILSKSSGTSTGSFSSTTAPAFEGTNMYTLQAGNLVAVDPSGSPNRWQFGNGNLVTAPVAIGGAVFVGSNTGTVYGVSARTGKQVWSGTAGTQIVGPNDEIGMAIGGGLLVVPAANVLTAFGN